MNWVIDVGNTGAKLGLFEGSEIKKIYKHLKTSELISLVKQAQPVQTILASVGQDTRELTKNITNYTNLLVLDSQTPIPIQNHYQTPETLGVDRLAAVVGAQVLYPQKACLVIDMGTCITYDLIDAEANYWGGNISLGLQMRFKALNHYTAQLPLIENLSHEEVSLVGKNTRNAIVNGVVNGLVAEIEGTIRAYQEKFADFERILCGGDAFFFESIIKEQIFVSSNLILVGLNRILQYNAHAKD